MGKIVELDYSTIVKIAAGEVIDRPASVVRELIDNSLDASSDRISIFITEGGKQYIEVSDNGTGMDKEDILICTKNHTTSKIKNFDGLNNLKSLGFRGEALSSIAEVSKMEVTSREKDSLVAYKIQIEGGKIINFSETSKNIGTTVIVEDLFFNIPARKKFLSSSITETKNIEKEIIKKALSFYNVGFEFHSDGKKKFIVPPKKSILERINDFYPDSIKDLIQIEKTLENFSLVGYISTPSFLRNSRQYEYLFVNNRPVEWKNFYFILNSVYEGIIPKGYYPAVFLYLSINPEYVDVNVHPMKKEVRFKDEAKITKIIKETMEEALNIKNVYQLEEKIEFTPYEERVSNAIREFLTSKDKEENYSQGFIFEKHEKPITEKKEENDFYNFKYIGSIFDTYLIFEDGEKVIFLDQHAAHERIMYEKLKKTYEEKILESQELFVPLKIDIPQIYVDILLENIEKIKAFGFEIEHFGENSFIVRSVPVFVDYMDIENIIMVFLESQKSTDYMDESIKQMACKSSIKAGKRISKEEVSSLLTELKKIENNITCPHGRPIIVTISKEELEKMFKRTGF